MAVGTLLGEPGTLGGGTQCLGPSARRLSTGPGGAVEGPERAATIAVQAADPQARAAAGPAAEHWTPRLSITTTSVGGPPGSLPPPSRDAKAAGGYATHWHHFVFLPHMGFLVVTLLSIAFLDPAPGLTAMSITSCLFALSVTLRSGGPYLTPSGVFVLASGVFIGGAGYYLGRVDTEIAVVDLRNAAVLAMLTTIGISVVSTAISVAWRLRWDVEPYEPDASVPDFKPPREFVVRGLVLLVLSQTPPVISILGPLAPAMGLTGVLVMALAASSRRVRMRWPGDLVLVGLVLLVPTLWVMLDFTGGGRIQVAGLGIAAFVGWNLIRPHSYQKVAVILSIPLFLIAAGQSRLDRGDDSTASSSSVLGDGEGLASVYSPLETWGEIIQPKSDEKQALLGPRRGGTFLNSLTLPIPRTVWDDKPDGFGRELVEALEVKGVSDSHSIAGLIQGEWYANFGYAGLFWMMPVMGFLLALLDRVHAALTRSRFRRPVDWWRAVFLMCVLSSMADLYWVGTFTWYARGGLAALVALLLGRMSTGRTRAPVSVHATGAGA